MVISVESTLRLISRAWGKQTGYVFFPWIDGDAEDRAQRVRGYNEGPAFKWPDEREKIIAHVEAHTQDDLYWCPSIFEKRVRRLDVAMDEHALWADLDEVKPDDIEEKFRPTIAWETSPGRYQALWLITSGDIQGASWPGNENQKLTYYLGADHSGWDTTQLLRVPGLENHKPAYKEANDGEPVQGRLLWHNGRRFLADEFEELPEVRGASQGNIESDALEEAIDAVDRLQVWGKTRLKVSKDVRELVSARSTGGQDRSDKLWQIERDLADAGLTVPEIVSIVRETVWNKFSGRNDELRRLVTEASKAVAERPEEVIQSLEKAREDKPKPGNLFTMVKEAEAPVWLVKDIITQGSCGFMAGEPKSYKSWAALDLALSVATGTPFLNAFDILEPGPVLYIQEEDPLPTLKDRLGKMAPDKTRDRVTFEDNGEGEHQLVWSPAEEDTILPKINAIVREQFIVSDPGWQAWLDEELEAGYDGEGAEPYRLLIMDPLMMVAGEVEENRAQDMTTKIFSPLKQLAEKHNLAISIVHHMRKGRDGDNGGTRGGQKMLGSVANHAWSESSLYFTHGRLGCMNVETESKAAASIRFEIKGLRKRTAQNALTWDPEVNVLNEEEASKEAAGSRGKRSTIESSGERKPRATRAVRIGQGTRRMIARSLDIDEDSTQSEIRAAWEAEGKVWGEWGDVVKTRDGSPARSHKTQEAAEPAAYKALKKLTARQAKAYSTHEVKEQMALELGQKPTQTIYLRAYQQLKKMWDLDLITRVEKDWLILGVTADDLIDSEIEDLI